MSYNDDRLRGALRRWRCEQADAEGLKPYHIFNDKALNAMIALRPHDIETLLQCHGIGPDKSRKYGLQLLQIIAHHTPGRQAAHHSPLSPYASSSIDMPPPGEAHANTPWTLEDTARLLQYSAAGKSFKHMAAMLGRSELAVEKRLAAHADPVARQLFSSAA